MEINFLLELIIGLVIILALLLYFLLYTPKKKKKQVLKKPQPSKRASIPTLKALVAIIKDKKTTTEELSDTIDSILKHYGTIHPKLGVRIHPDFKIYGAIMLRICHHPNTNKKIILKFDKELRVKNPAYTQEINDFLTKGLDTRGM